MTPPRGIRVFTGPPYINTETVILTHGGMGYAAHSHIERYHRESWKPRIAPVSAQMIMNVISEKVLSLPKSY